MTFNAKYSDKYWKSISSIAQLTGFLMTYADDSGKQGTINQLEVAIKVITEGKVRYPGNKLIASIVIDGESEDEVLEKTRVQQSNVYQRFQVTIKDFKEFQNIVFGMYAEVIHNISLVERAVTVNEFKKWLLSIAEEVAVAGIKNEDEVFTEKERVIFNKIRKALQRI